MPRFLLPLVVALAACASLPADAQDAAARTVAPPPLTETAIKLDPRRDEVRTALAAADRGQFSAAQRSALASHPVAGWIEFASLKRDLDTLPTARAQAFLAKYRDQAVGDAFRDLWLASLARRPITSPQPSPSQSRASSS